MRVLSNGQCCGGGTRRDRGRVCGHVWCDHHSIAIIGPSAISAPRDDAVPLEFRAEPKITDSAERSVLVARLVMLVGSVLDTAIEFEPFIDGI